jgi:hypothetical protein
MNEAVEKKIEKVKQNLTDYLSLCDLIGATQEEQEIQINMMLDDLIVLLKLRKESN